MEEKMTLRSKSGKDITFEKKYSKVNPDISIQVSVPGIEKFGIQTSISEEQGFQGVSSNSQVYINGKLQRVFIPFEKIEIEKIQDYFQRLETERKDRRSHWMELNLGICFNSDYSCHWWRGDDRTPFETILVEGKNKLSCCHKEESIEESIREAYNAHFAEMRKVEEKKAERKEKEEKALKEAKETGKSVLIRKYSVGCNDPNEECDFDIVYIYANPDGKIEKKQHHTW